MTRASQPPAVAAYALLADGTTVCVRPVVPADRAAVFRFYEHMSAENLRLRFFSAGTLVARQAADALCRDAGPGDRAVVAEATGEVVGLAEYHAAPVAGEASAEVALAVADEWHHRGVATLLLEHLVDLARTEGIKELTADALAENLPVIRVFADLGLPVRRCFEGPEVHVRVALTPDEQYLTALDTRGRTADVASLRPLLRPRSVAVVGAGHRPGSVGRAILRNLRAASFAGPLYVVNPHGPALDDLPCHPSVAELPEAPDLAVLAVPPRLVPSVAEECGVRGVRALLVVTSGLDREQATALRAACRTHGMRMAGPNCLGLANTEKKGGRAKPERLVAHSTDQPFLRGRAQVVVIHVRHILRSCTGCRRTPSRARLSVTSRQRVTESGAHGPGLRGQAEDDRVAVAPLPGGRPDPPLRVACLFRLRRWGRSTGLFNRRVECVA
ncbi:GNAT family N-acetyltransferase [Streptomyces abikoensis]|uniref:GNAT family N-acetyltransferase n=1 Tax=Streptomyces abikoensis TaxID=97398 RepID=UPI003406A092